MVNAYDSSRTACSSAAWAVLHLVLNSIAKQVGYRVEVTAASLVEAVGSLVEESVANFAHSVIHTVVASKGAPTTMPGSLLVPEFHAEAILAS